VEARWNVVLGCDPRHIARMDLHRVLFRERRPGVADSELDWYMSDNRVRRIGVSEADIHPHLEARMRQRGVTLKEIERTLNEGWEAQDAKAGTGGKVLIFPHQGEWEGQFFEEKEVSVYYRTVGEKTLILTVKARYGRDFPRGGSHES
jgi:hypothetical protein